MKATVVYGRLPAGSRKPAEGAFAIILNSAGLVIKVTGLAQLRLEEVEFTLEPGCTDRLRVGLPNAYPLSRTMFVEVLVDGLRMNCLETDRMVPRIVPGDAHSLELQFQ